MGFINVAERTINAKLVYYGVGFGGKTTSLQQVHGIFCPHNEVQLLSISTEEDSTLMFDFLPINLGNVGGFKIRIQGYTVPGQPKYRRMRKYVLQGADAVVFVVDSQSSRLQENIESLQSMRDNLQVSAGTSADIPIVLQYNKRDLGDILSQAELDEVFCFRDNIEAFPTVATDGQGVFETFVHAAGLLIESKVELYGLGDSVDAKTIADEARQRLWDACDEARRSRTVVAIEDVPQVKLEIAEEGIDDLSGGAAEGDWQAPELLDEINRPAIDDAVAVDGVFADDDIQLDYSLNEVSGPGGTAPGSDQVLSDEELDIDLNAMVDFETDESSVSLDGSMLDQSVQANLQLAERFGALDEERVRYKRKVDELVDCTQSAVHDLKRPLSALGMMLKLINKGTLGEVPERVNGAVQNGLEAVDVMSKLVQDLLDSSQLDHNGVQLNFCACDIGQVVGDVAQTLHFEIEARAVELRIADMPEIQADPWGLNKVFMNLIGNALSFGAPERAPVIEVSCKEVGSEWEVTVRDNGIGIPEEDRSRLFRRFERGSNTCGISGSGLGLHIVREIVQGHGGCVEFTSEVGEGTTFVLRLPKEPQQAPHSPVSQVAEQPSL